ncbi:MAG: aminopeptidase [Candidatus Promineifilaceae bacterium]|nr:aminopeptidase [Candidatus Promineifilaceae bacterium]
MNELQLDEGALQETLEKYADLIVRVGLNLQPGQPLIIQNYRHGGVNLQAAPLVRAITAAAYRAGAGDVHVVWGDDEIQRMRFAEAEKESLTRPPELEAAFTQRIVDEGGALLTLMANDPDLLAEADPERVSTVQRAVMEAFSDVREKVTRNEVNWLVAAAAVPAWAARVFPDLPPDEQQMALWVALFHACRVDQTDPIAAWEEHLRRLERARDHLNARSYRALHFSGPGTDLRVGLPEGHIWASGAATSSNGIRFTPNLPTEEVFTLPHRERVEGTVTATRPLSYGGRLIRDFSLTFEAGRVTDIRAGQGEAVLRQLVEMDEGASRLGEVALVPGSSPIYQSGLLFYNTLYDENAASHLALGRAYKVNLQGGAAMSDEAFAEHGGNSSLAHVDFMIGSPELDVDGEMEDGTLEPVMREGEFVLGS